VEHAVEESDVFTRGQAVTLVWRADGSTVQIIISAVLKLFSNAITDNNLKLISVEDCLRPG